MAELLIRSLSSAKKLRGNFSNLGSKTKQTQNIYKQVMKSIKISLKISLCKQCAHHFKTLTPMMLKKGKLYIQLKYGKPHPSHGIGMIMTMNL